MSNNTNQNFSAVHEADEEFDLPLEEQNSRKNAWIKFFAAKYGDQSIKRMHGGLVEFFVDLPIEFIENKLLRKWGIGKGSKLIIRFMPTPKVLHLSKNETLEKFSVRTQVESMLESIINKLTKDTRDAEKEPDPKALKELIDMGFNPEFVGLTLIEVENDIERAIEVFDIVASKIKAMNNAKQNYVKHGLYVAIREYIIERLPYMTSFCAICDGVHIDNPNAEQSSVCSRELCTFRFKSMQLLAPDYYYVPTRVNNVPKKEIVSIAAGSHHSVFCTFDGAVYSWGEGTQGQLGNGYDEDKSAPVCIDTPVKFVKVAAGEQHTVGLSAQKELYVWGSGTEALGFGAPVKYNTPQKLFVSEWIRHISVVGNQNFALSEEGTIWVWGNILGQVYATPTKLNIGARFITVRASLRAPTAVDQRGSIWLWTKDAKGFERIVQRTEQVAKYQREDPPPDPIVIMKDAATYGPTLIAITQKNKMLFFDLKDIVRRRATGKLCLFVEKSRQYVDIQSLVIGHNYAAVIDTSRSVHIIGHGKAVLGVGEDITSVPAWSAVPLPSTALLLVTGPSHVLCLTIEQDLYVWGRNHGASGFAINSSINDMDNDVKVPANFTSPIVFKEVNEELFIAPSPQPAAPSVGPTVFKPNLVHNLQRPHPGQLKFKAPQGEVPPPPYPPMNRGLTVAPHLGTRHRYLAIKDGEMTNRLRYSPYHIEQPQVKRGVEKYSDRTVQQNNFKPNVTNLLKDHSEYFPSELTTSSRKKVDEATRFAHTLRNLDDYEKKETAYKENKKNSKDKDKEEKEDDEDEVMADEDEEEDNDDEFHDYHVNHFDDDDNGMSLTVIMNRT